MAGFTERELPILPTDPYPVTFVNSKGSIYEYARRHTTLEAPVDVGSMATGRLAILGIHTSPSFYKSIDIVVGIASSVTQHASVHSEPYLFTGISTLNNTRLHDAWHFRADHFTGTQGIGISWGIVDEFGFAFSKPSLADNSYGFYYGPVGSSGTTGHWGVFIRDDVSNYFEDLVLIGEYASIGEDGENRPEPILQVFDNNNKRGEYVESIVGIATRPDIRYQLHVRKANYATKSAKFIGDVEVIGDFVVDGSISGSIDGANITGSLSGASIDGGNITGSISGSVISGNISGKSTGLTGSPGITVSSVRSTDLSGSGNRAVYSDADGNLTNSSSDERLKENVINLSYGLDTICNLTPISFNWIDKEKLGSQKEIGLIAQEVQQYVPEVIGVSSDETLTLDYAKLTPVLIKAVQELKSENDFLKSQIETIKRYVGISS